MNGPFIASGPGAPCCECGKKIGTGKRVWYRTGWLDDDERTCADCVSLDLFGAAS